METSKIGITNSAGVSADLRLNGNQLKNIPTDATGSITLTVTKGVSSKLEAVSTDDGALLLLNDEKMLELSGSNHPDNIVITAQHGQYTFISLLLRSAIDHG